MPLIRNSLVFLDTGFFKSHKTTDNVYRDFLIYSKDRKIRLCTSEMCLKEWHSQKVEQLESYFRTSQEKYSYLRRDSIVADEILSRYPGQYPDAEEIRKIAGEVIERFVKEREIQVYPATKEHIDRTFGAYFNGDPPYRDRKEKADILDSWIFEAAKDARFDQEHKSLQNRFCIGADNGLNAHLEQLGLRPINKSDLLDLLQREEQQLVGGGPEIQAPSVQQKESETISPAAPGEGGLETVLRTAISTELREIYIRVLGYTYWMSGPAKKDLIEMLEAKGLPRQLIEASVAILSQPSLKLITDRVINSDTDEWGSSLLRYISPRLASTHRGIILDYEIDIIIRRSFRGFFCHRNKHQFIIQFHCPYFANQPAITKRVWP